MNKLEAIAIANEWLGRLRVEPYATLASRIGHPPVTEHVMQRGVVYQVQVSYYWDGEAGGDVRVIVAIDDGGMRAFFPVTSDFIKSPTEQFIGE